MKITLVPSTVSGVVGDPMQFGTSYIINDTLAIDAGTLGFYGSPHDQAKIKHVLISHSHADHIASLPIFVENAFEGKPECVTIYGNRQVMECIRQDIFNDRVWPDFVRLSEGPMKQTPLVKLVEIEAGQTLTFDDLEITTVPVDHLVPTLGFIIREGQTRVVIPSDTGPTEEIWRIVNGLPPVKAIFLEVCFPDHMVGLANASKHLIPSTFRTEVLKVNSPERIGADPAKAIPFHAVHLKARFREQVIEELQRLQIPGLHIARFGIPYLF